MEKLKTKRLWMALLLIMLIACLTAVGFGMVHPHSAHAETAANAGSAIEAETTFATTVTQHETLAAAWEYANTNSSVDSAVTIKLLKNCNTAAGFVVDAGKNIILDLNGCTVDRGLKSATTDGYVIKVLGKFTLDDSLSGGTVTGGNNVENGGGLHAVKGSEVMILGGKISGNYAQQGGGVYSNRGAFTMTDGIISGNTVSDSGGGLYASFTKIAVNGGEISGNNASTGAGVYVGGGSLDIGNGSKITGNTASYSGGGIYGATVTLTMSGGEISSNKANGAAGGGGIYCYGGTKFNMSGGTIKGNTSTSYGGGVFFSTGEFTMSGSASITQNTANNSGGGASLTGVTFKMSGSSSITLNSAYGGGGLFLADDTVATLTDATISDNTASANSGGIFMSGNVTLMINGGTISTANFYAIYSLSNTGKILINQEATILSGSDKPQICTKTALVFAEGLNPTKNYSMEWDGSWEKGTVLINGCGDLSKFTFVLSDKSKKIAALDNNIVLDTYSVKASKIVSDDFIALYTDDLGEAIHSVLSTENATVELFKDVTVNESMVIASGATVNLKLNGYTITGQGSGQSSLFKVDGTLVLITSEDGGITSSSGYAIYANSGSITFDGDVSLTSESGFAQIFTKNAITVPSGVTLTGSYTVECGEMNALGIPVVSGAATGFTLVNENFTAVAEGNNLLLYATIAERPAENTSTFTYTGNEQTYTLTESEYYTVEGNKRTVSGSQKVTVSLSPYYTWTDGGMDDVTFDFTIAKAIVEKPTEDSSAFTYTGLAQTYQPSGFDSLFMTISGNEQTNASGSGYSVTVALDAENCQWSTGGADDVTFCFIISKATQIINTDNVNLHYTYTGALQTVGGGATVGDSEQTVSYENNTFTTVAEGNGKLVTISAAETDNYLANSVTVTLIVQKANYDISGITFSNATAEYDGKNHSLTVSGTLPTGADGISLTVSYFGSAANVADGAVNVTATFATTSANYNVPAAMIAAVTITPKVVDLSWAEIAYLTYSGEAKTTTATALGLIDGDACSVTVSLTDGTDNVNAGKFSYTATGLSNRNYKLPADATSGEYTVTAKTLTIDMIAEIASVVYNGQAQQPNVTVSDGDLLKDTDYELAFLYNTDAGTATVTITAKGNYTGTVTQTFTIQKAEIDMSGITFEDKTVVHNGTAFGIEITGELPSNVTVTYSENETAAGIYTMTATFAATSENYIVPAAMTATLTIRYDKQEQPGDDGEGGTVIIESPEGIDPSHKLSANDVTDNYSPALDVESTIGKNQEIKQVYNVKLLDSNNVAVQPDGLLTIRLLLAENYRNLTELKVYVMDGATMTELTATRDGNYLVFSTAQLAEYAIVGEAPNDGLSVGLIVCIVLASILFLLFLLLLILFLLRKDKSQGFGGYCTGLFKRDGKNAKNEVSDEPSATRAKNQESHGNDGDYKE